MSTISPDAAPNVAFSRGAFEPKVAMEYIRRDFEVEKTNKHFPLSGVARRKEELFGKAVRVLPLTNCRVGSSWRRNLQQLLGSAFESIT